MTDFPLHTIESVPEGSRESFSAIIKKYGFVPNLAAVIAESPAALTGFLALAGSFESEAMTLEPVERQIVLLAVSVANGCDYCTAAHGMMASMAGLDRNQITVMQQGGSLASPRYEALRCLATRITETRGWPEEAVIEEALNQGFTKGQILEVVLGVTLKTFTNYVNHLTRPPINAEFAAFAPMKAA